MLLQKGEKERTIPPLQKFNMERIMGFEAKINN